MADYIVKNGGTATGDAGRYTSAQTGSFAALGAANYYNNIAAAQSATTSPTSGDRILFSDLHSYSVGSAINYTGVSSLDLHIICVDDANMDAGRTSGNRGAETCTSTSADNVFTNAVVSGVKLTGGDNIIGRNASVFIDSEIVLSGGGDNLFLGGADNISLKLENSILAMNATSAYINIGNGAFFRMSGGSVTSTTTVTSFISGSAANGGMSAELNGVDLSAVGGTLISGMGASTTADDIVSVKFDMCKIATGVAFTSETFTGIHHRALFTRCSDTSAAAEYQYHLHAFGGDVDDDSTIKRAEDPAFADSGTTISYKIVTDANANAAVPLWFDVPINRSAELSSASTDTLRFYVASTVALTNKDIWIEVLYPDGTNKQTPNLASSANTTPDGSIDLMSAGTALTTDAASDWRDGVGALAGHNEYSIDVSTAADAGADTVPIVRVYIGKPSTTIQLSSIYELS